MFDWIECMMGELLGLKVMASLEMEIWLGQKGSSVLYCIGDSVEGRWGVVLDFCFFKIFKWPSC